MHPRRIVMKKLFSVLICILSISALNAPAFGWATSEGSVYAKGNMLGSAGLSIYPLGVLAGFDYGLHDCISAGLAAGYNNSSWAPQVRTHQVPIMARVAFHPFNLKVLSDKIVIRNMIDVYAGLNTGWIFRWYSSDLGIQSPDDASYFGLREYIGMRYFVNDKLAIFVEDNNYLSYIGFGVTYKF